MLKSRRVLVTLLVSGALAIAGCAKPATVEVPGYQPPLLATPAALKGRAVGMAGCLAAACHGAPASDTLKGVIDANTWQSSGSCWAAADPHTAAYSVLEGELATSIMAKYAPGTHATQDARCLACHTNPTLAVMKPSDDPKLIEVLRKEGVSCEACHGNAGGWIEQHTTWRGNRTEVYAKTGMNPLNDIGHRALACAGCHVGAPAENNGLPVRDMNHDMIAAGHPRLNFDFAEYQRRLPQHWQEKDRSLSNQPERTLNSAKVWYIGRVAHAEAACKLLADRAQRAEANDPRSPWPEFAEFNCAACHHDLRVRTAKEAYGDWRKSDAYLAGRLPGSTPWQTIWPIGHAPGIEMPKRGESRLKDVVLAMELLKPAKANAANTAAQKTAAELEQRRYEILGLTDAKVEGIARSYFPSRALQVPEWDSATQLFFGYAALERTRGKANEQVLKNYRAGVTAFRAQDWFGVEKAFEAIRK